MFLGYDFIFIEILYINYKLDFLLFGLGRKVVIQEVFLFFDVGFYLVVKIIFK